MITHPTSFKVWQSYPSSLDPIHVVWLNQAKKSETAFGATKKIALVNDQ